MSDATERDIEKSYPAAEFVSKLRRLADSLEKGGRFEIRIAGERINIPARATCAIEHERERGREEIEFQLKWPAKRPARAAPQGALKAAVPGPAPGLRVLRALRREIEALRAKSR